MQNAELEERAQGRTKGVPWPPSIIPKWWWAQHAPLGWCAQVSWTWTLFHIQQNRTRFYLLPQICYVAKKYLLVLPSRDVWESQFLSEKNKNPTQNSKQETLISLPGNSIALWKCYPTVTATFSSCLCVIYGLKMGVNLPYKHRRGSKAGRGSGRSGGWRGNAKEQDLYYLTTYIYSDKIFIVFYG